MEDTMKSALEGIRVLEYTHVISGSYCGQILGDLGAEVIKMERPEVGEFYREEAIKNADGISLVYPNYNRNKKGITLNLKHEKAKEITLKLVEKCDIFIENYRPGLLKKMGLGFEELKKINPKLVMVSISGFGQSGPYTNKPAYDMTIAATCGFMSLTGPEGVPTKSGPAISDFLSGMYGALGAIAALRRAEKTGEGEYIDVSIMECAMSILDAFFAQSQFTGVEPHGTGNRRQNYAPVNSFETKDGHIYISCSLEKHWDILTRLMNRRDIYDHPKFVTRKQRKENEDEVEAIVEEWTKSHTTDELLAMMDENGMPCAPIQSINQVRKDPQVLSRSSIVEFDYPGLGSYPVVAFPPKFTNMKTPLVPAPTLGQHNKDVYTDLLGITKQEIDSMLADKLI
jgi:crotonobetainyl-CoA:carnitine CoA-transferase CaiB-like acyl-CoA transferase